jgi:hypothetical protein
VADVTARRYVHTCYATIIVVPDDDHGIWRFYDEDGLPVSTCPRCGRRLSRGKLRPMIRETVRGERGHAS